MQRARDSALRALELDPDLPEAHAYLGAFVSGVYERNWKEADRRFRIALAHEPVHWHVRIWYDSFHLLPLGRLAEARREAERALQDNPLSQICYWGLALTLEALGLEPQAGAAWKRSAELDPDFWMAWMMLGMHHAVYGSHAEARRCAEKAFALFPVSPYIVGVLAGTLANAGDTARARSLLDGLHPDAHGTPVAQAYYHLAVGDLDPAVEWTRKAMEKRHFMLIPNFIRPYEKFLSKSPAWPGLLKQLGLEPATTD